jgi:hypothetical protein
MSLRGQVCARVIATPSHNNAPGQCRDILASVAVAALYRRGTGSPLGVVVAPVFPVLSLPLVDVVLPGLYA